MSTRQSSGDGEASDSSAGGNEGHGGSDERDPERLDGAFRQVDGQKIAWVVASHMPIH